jgi:hypothetical protein
MRRVVSSLALMTMGWLSNLPTATSFTELVWPVRGGPMGVSVARILDGDDALTGRDDVGSH